MNKEKLIGLATKQFKLDINSTHGLTTVSNRASHTDGKCRTMKRFTLSAILLLPMLARANQEWFFADGFGLDEFGPSMGLEPVWLIGMYAAAGFAMAAMHALWRRSDGWVRRSLVYACCAGASAAFPVVAGFMMGAVVAVLIVLLGLSRK